MPPTSGCPDRKAIISKGKLKCAGSSLFLKNRFGIGYHLKLNSTGTTYIPQGIETKRLYLCWWWQCGAGPRHLCRRGWQLGALPCGWGQGDPAVQMLKMLWFGLTGCGHPADGERKLCACISSGSVTSGKCSAW
ncbi:ABCA5 [Cordylochernes scorpioides]|uniref:ABCA5 n=1 Tax=Cordylochernes scorpioides TaxID=51811 RepID=A0ABY6JUZ6_9ARAC|nr:ABCA5 [Cordylochernes scorpioides]